MPKEIIKKFSIWCVMFRLIFQTTSAYENFWFLPTTFRDGHSEGEPTGFQTIYTLNENCSFDSEYRTLDGSCNHRTEQIKGRAFTPFKRFIPSDYKDGMGAPYTNRPSPRDLSLLLFKANTNESHGVRINDWFVIFGQFLIHDFALAASNLGSISCCPEPSNISECMPIIPKSDDELYLNNVTCLNFVRSLGVGPITEEPGTRQQLNQISHYLDASNLYGSSENELYSLLDRETGKMKVTDLGSGSLLPTRERKGARNNCPLFDAGDHRVIENVILAVFHTIWTREHNFILDKLAEINPEWNVTLLFEETRKIIIAEMQVISYLEFLPLLIGDNLTQDYFLGVNQSDYDQDRDPAISNAFTTAAFRYGHAMVDDFLYLIQNSTDHAKGNTTGFCNRELNSFSCNTTHIVPLIEALENMDSIYSCQNSVEAFILGSIHKLAQKANDLKVAAGLTSSSPRIHDLISFNIQRGRDHGLPTYNAWRKFCGLDPVDFQSDSNTHTGICFEKLKKIYRHEDDIDLFIGGILEKNIEGAVLGPTFACICAKQFSDTKFGDRYWYEFNQFSIDQINEINNQTMSKVILRNTNIHSLPSKAFNCPNDDNPIISQEESYFDISHWKS